MRLLNQALAVVAILLCQIPALAQAVDWVQLNQDSLKGLPGVVVYIQFSSVDAYPDDPNERELHASIEKRLKDAGVPIFNRPYGKTDNYPTLNVAVGFKNFDIFFYEIDVTAALRQEVSVVAQPDLKLTATTWRWGRSALVAGSRKRDFISDVVDKFICDFRKANPNLTGPLPDCDLPAPPLDRAESPGSQPTVMTALEDELLRASALNQIEDVKSLIAKGADVNARDPADATPLWYAVRSGSRPVGDTKVLTLLLQHGADVNVGILCRLTPLMYAIQRGDLKALEILLGHGADPNAATADGHTALMAASILGAPEAVTLLLNKGAKVNARTRYGGTALSLARENRNRIPGYARTGATAPYISTPEAELLKQTQLRHDRVIGLLQSAAGRTRK